MKISIIKPQILQIFREKYFPEKFIKDLIAGIIVGIVALPLSIALAIASGAKPEQGLYTAIFAGFAMSLFSGSRFQISGPTGAFIVIVYGIMAEFGYSGLAAAGFLAGIMLIVMGLSGLGSLIKFIPYPVTIGFTAGIGVLIFSGQLGDFFGLTLEKVPGEFLEKMLVYAEHASTANIYSILIGLLSILIILYWPKINRKIPGTLIAIIVSTLLVQLLKLPVETIQSRFGSIPSSFPPIAIPHIEFSMLRKLLSPALTIALLAGIESLLSAVVADGMKGTKHDSNTELFAQGLGNIISPIFGGIPATGAIARTATNIKNGAVSPVSGLIHSVTLLAIMLAFGRYAALIPMASLAAILMVVAWNMSELPLFIKLFKGPKSDVAVLLSTFLLTVFADLTVAIQFGFVLAALLFMRRMSDVTETGFVTGMLENHDDETVDLSITDRKLAKGIEVFEIYGPFFFGVADKFKDELKEINEQPEVFILRMRHVPAMDATGLKALEELFIKTRKDHMTLILSGVQEQPLNIIKKAGLDEKIGKENICSNINTALARAEQLLA